MILAFKNIFSIEFYEKQELSGIKNAIKKVKNNLYDGREYFHIIYLKKDEYLESIKNWNSTITTKKKKRIQKYTMPLNRQFSKEDIEWWMHMKQCSKLLVIREIKSEL